ncbi:MAG: 4Fe-4S binding protein, partial [Candidatus Thorarchaeota archaeon]
MQVSSPLISLLDSNKEKILEVGKYKSSEYEELIDSLSKAEEKRYLILNQIKQSGYINIDEIKQEVNLTKGEIEANIDYLRELGLLGFINEHPRFFKEIIESSDKKGIFPSTKLIKEKNLCCGCGLCVAVCPVNAIDYTEGTFEIDEESCIECGLCFSACPRSFFPLQLEKIEMNNDPRVKYTEQFHYFRKLF